MTRGKAERQSRTLSERALMLGWHEELNEMTIKPTIQKTRFRQRASKPQRCLGMDRGPHLGQRS
jgi:hypothetical protein